ncbi:MAG: universal stress protein [Planctomycetota bacterium]|nr:universal stress protein [Planctomycetota bacterium]
MKRILACIDFSPVTAPVLDAAVELAQATKAGLTLIHVVVPPTPVSYGEFAPAMPVPDMLPEMRKAAIVQMQREQARLESEFGIKVATVVVDGSQPSTAVLEEASRIEPDMIVVGSHGHGLFGRLLLGSTCNQIVHHSRWPVLVVPSVKVRELKPFGAKRFAAKV